MGRRIVFLLTGLALAIVITTGLIGCKDMDLRALIEQRVKGLFGLSAGTYEAYFPNGGALSGSVSGVGEKELTFEWSE